MSALTNRQRVKMNAALATIYAHGFDPNAVIREARQVMATGRSPVASYELALNRFAESNPGVGSSIAAVTRLIEASDVPTLAQYDAALKLFNETGDESGLEAMHDTIVQDSLALAVRHGEITPEDAAAIQESGGHGLVLNPDHVQAATTPDPLADMPTPPAPVPTEKFSFNIGGDQPAPARTAQPTNPGTPRPSSDTAVRAGMSDYSARSWAGVPVDVTPGIRTATGGYRAPLKGDRLASVIGVPLASAAGQAAAAAENGIA